MNKGFTLIELLAVLIVLAVIALITIPLVKNTIDDSQEKADKASIDMYAKSAKEAIQKYQMENEEYPESFSDIEPYIKYSGNEVECEKKVLSDETEIALENCRVDGRTVDYTYGSYEE